MSIFKLSAADEQYTLDHAMEDKKFTIVKLPNSKENTMNTKLNFAQRYMIWENNLVCGHIPGLRWIAKTNNKLVARRPKTSYFAFLAMWAFRVNHVVNIINKRTAGNLYAGKPVITDELRAQWAAITDATLGEAEIEKMTEKHQAIIEAQGPHYESDCELFKQTNSYCHLCIFEF